MTDRISFKSRSISFNMGIILSARGASAVSRT